MLRAGVAAAPERPPQDAYHPAPNLQACGSFEPPRVCKAPADWQEGPRSPNTRRVTSADRLVGEARARQPVRMPTRERVVVGGLAVGFLLAAAAIAAYLPSDRTADPATLALLVGMYAVFSRVEFEVGSGYAVPEQLVFVPMLFLAPLPLVPVLVAAGFVLAAVPDFLTHRTHVDRWLSCLADAWFTVGPVLVIGLLASGEPRLELFPVYALALAAQVVVGFAAFVVAESVASHRPLSELLLAGMWSYRIDAILSPVALLAAVAAQDEPLGLLALGPLVWLLSVFSRERKERYGASLELNRAYRGTVMLLADVVEADDNYTADHCRSVVELVSAVADQLEIHPDERQELEFAALLHDVGKISIPKEIINKPAALTDDEFALIKSHTVEGQMLLDRVGGLLTRVGATVRSCHERWDGAGYPDGLAGREIPWAARIVFTCDAYNAMTTNRPYRRAMSQETALEELWANAGRQFDPRIVAAVSNVIREHRVDADQAAAEVRTMLVRALPRELGATT